MPNEKDKANQRDSVVEEPTKKEQREGLVAANKAELDTLPLGQAEDSYGNLTTQFGPETEYERAIRVNGDPVKKEREARERAAADEKAHDKAVKAAKASREGSE